MDRCPDSDTLGRGQMYDGLQHPAAELSQLPGVGQVIVGAKLAAGVAGGDEPTALNQYGQSPLETVRQRARRDQPSTGQGPAGSNAGAGLGNAAS